MISSGPLEDRLAIRELVDSYNDAVMRFDGEAWAANWRDDATWCLGGNDVTGKTISFPYGRAPWTGSASSGFSPLRAPSS